jgi:signal transduction histidine kinase
MRFLALWRVPEALAAQHDDQALLAFVRDQLREPDTFMCEVRNLYDTPDAESMDELQFKDGRVFERYSRPQRVDGTIVGRVWSFRDVSERVELLRNALLLADAGRLLATLDVEPALEAVAQLVVPTLGAECTIDLFGDAAPRRWSATSHASAIRPELVLPGPVLAGHSILYEAAGGARISVPFAIRGRVVGAITVVAARGRAYARDDLELVEELARRAAIALENTKLYRAAQDEVVAREEFLAVAVHEIRGPLTAIRLAVQTFGKGIASDARLVAVIEREERRLTRLVDDLLDVGRFRAKQLVFSLEAVDLAGVVRDVAARLSPDLTRCGSSLSIESAGPIVGNWDRMRLEQVVTNLLSNAIKFGLGNPIEVTLGIRDGRASLAVGDHGIGIRADLVGEIFEPFKRAVASQHYEGLGLGLYIVRTIVEGLGGEIAVRSTPGAGSTFTVSLPLDAHP